MMATFDHLVTLEQWTRELNRLLERAAAAAVAGTGAVAVQQDLFAFIKASPGKCDFLDVIAAGAAHDLFDRETARLIASIESRQRELQVATKTLQSVTAEVGRSERDLKFERLIETLHVSTSLIEELKAVERELTAEQRSTLDKALAIAESIEDVRRLVQEFRTTDQAATRVA
jgi:hypothetical protein